MDTITLNQTCGACPEQYDVFYAGDQIGYLRLRHGHYTAHVHNHRGEVVYEADTEGDGMFEPHERRFEIEAGVRAIWERIHGPVSDEGFRALSLEIND